MNFRVKEGGGCLLKGGIFSRTCIICISSIQCMWHCFHLQWMKSKIWIRKVRKDYNYLTVVMEIYAIITPIVMTSLPEHLASFHMVDYFMGKKVYELFHKLCDPVNDTHNWHVNVTRNHGLVWPMSALWHLRATPCTTSETFALGRLLLTNSVLSVREGASIIPLLCVVIPKPL